jgi:GNAT superfamily N-acetyltransferase
MVSYASTRFADATILDGEGLAGADLADDEFRWQAEFDPANGRLLTVDVGSGPPMWFVEDDSGLAAEPPEMALIAFGSDHFPPGFVLSNDEFEGMAITNKEQIGAIKWWPGNGQIHEIYVQPAHRRQGAGGGLIHAAGAHQITAGRPTLWSSGERTDLGEAFARSRGGVIRVRPRNRRMPPMTPEEGREGVPDRNLLPDPGSIPDAPAPPG